jgi:hypothetical protein
MRRIIQCLAAGMLLCLALGCFVIAPSGTTPVATAPLPVRLQNVNLNDVASPVANDQPVSIAAASNEWTNFTLQVKLPEPKGYWIRLHPPRQSSGAIIPVTSFSAFQVLAMPVDMDRAGYIRHTGKVAAHRNVPRALLPQVIDQDGVLNLGTLRNPTRPTDPRSHAGGPGAEPAMIWFDVHVPKNTLAGDYACGIDLMTANDLTSPMFTLPLKISVYDFELSDLRHLEMVGRLSWDRLVKLYPAQFETFTPSWVNRRESRYQQTVRTLDHLVALAQENRANLVVPELKPIVKWPAGQGPQIDWNDFDSMVRPWFNGDSFPDHTGLRYWPLPEAELLDRYQRPSQLQYWTAAAVHFEANDWLKMTAVSLEKPSPGTTGPAESIDLSNQAAELLGCHPGLRVLLPLQDEQIHLATSSDPSGVDPATVSRLLTASAALVSTPLPQRFREDVPRHWLRTDLPGLVPYIGAGGDEHDARVWAWLAFLRHNVKHKIEQNFILWDTTLPITAGPDQPANPGELVWFYPGEWFGVDLPVPTVQLKWLRRAQQDYEYLLLAQIRGETINALQLARLITKPVELQPGQPPDPVYALMTGTTSLAAWAEAERLMADTILLRKPGQPVSPDRQREVYIRTLLLSAPQERRMLMGRAADWSWHINAPGRRDPGTWVDLKFSLDVYNASENTPDQNRLRWSQVPPGWSVNPEEVELPRLDTYHVYRATLSQKFNLDHLTPSGREPMELQYIDGFTNVVSPLKFVLPVVSSDRREGRLAIDGVLDDWSPSDVLHDGPMVKMFSRPALQRQEMQLASTNSTVYTSWAKDNFYLAFSLDGLGPPSHRTQNFVDYQQRRAWGEDLCEILIQPIAADNTLGPVLHVVCKPNGGDWVERKTDLHPYSEAWKPLETATIRYAATTPESTNTWRGEIAIPWSAIMGAGGKIPTLLRFNFTQHKAATGESATWAGPVDFGRDETFMGLIYLRSPGGRGANGIGGGE